MQQQFYFFLTHYKCWIKRKKTKQTPNKIPPQTEMKTKSKRKQRKKIISINHLLTHFKVSPLTTKRAFFFFFSLLFCSTFTDFMICVCGLRRRRRRRRRREKNVDNNDDDDDVGSWEQAIVFSVLEWKDIVLLLR
jgi:hypothetical protein